MASAEIFPGWQRRNFAYPLWRHDSILHSGGSWRRSIVATINGSQRVGGFNPRWRSSGVCERGSNVAWWFAKYNVEFVAAIVVFLCRVGKLYCCYAEGRAFDSSFKWFRATQHCGCNTYAGCWRYNANGMDVHKTL